MEFLRSNSLLRTFVISNFDSDELECRIIFQILTSVTGHQIKELSLIDSNIDNDSLKILNPGLSHHSHLCKLDLSNNNISDNGLGELASIFPSITALVELNLSHNLIQGKAEKFEEFFTSAQLNLEDLKVNLSHNKIEDQCITILELAVFHAEEIKITDLDLSFNKFTNEGVYKISEAYRQGKNKGKFKLKLLPMPFHEGYLKPIFMEKRANMNIALQRIAFFDKEKNPPCSKQWLDDIKKIVRNIRTIRGQSLTIERMATICHEIYGLEYEFPNKKLDELRDIIWDLINRAIEIEDFYALTILQVSAKKIGLELYSLTGSLRTIRNKTNSLTRRMVRVINFDYPEADLNKELDELVVEIFKYDLRGSLVDSLLSIKEKMDEYIKKMINSKDKEVEFEDEDTVSESKKDPFWFLESDLEYAKMTPSYMEDLIGFDINLFVHPKNLNYFEMCKMMQEKLEKDLLTYKEKTTNKEPNYYQMNLYNRSLFLLADHVYKFYLNIWKFSKGDLNLNCSRLAIQYLNFSKRKELCNILDPRPVKPLKLQYSKQNYQMPDNLFSFQIDNGMTKYLHIRPNDLEKADSFHKNSDTQQIGGARLHRGGLALADFNPATMKTGGVISELVANEKGGQAKDKEKLGFTKTVLDYVPGPLLGPLRKAKSDNFSQDAISVYQKIQIILDNDADCQDEKFLKLIQDLLRKLVTSRAAYDLDSEPDALLDECYLQLYRYCNRGKETRANYNQRLAFKLISILSLYAPPSEDLQDQIRAWMFAKISDQSLEPFIKKTLINLMNHDNNEFVQPYWIPSLIEIRERLKGEKEILISFTFCEEKITGTLPIYEFETIESFMTKLYESQYLKHFDDKYSFWLYKATNSKEEDIALLNDEIMLEVLSFCDENSCILLVQRRISCMAFSLNYMKLDENHLNSFFYQTKRNYIMKDKFSDFCKADSIARLAAILYTIERGLKNKKVVAKSEKLQKKLKYLIPESWLFKLTSSQLIQKIVPYLMQANIINQEIWSLKQEFLNSLKSYPLFVGIHYECQIQDNLSGNKNARVDMMLNVNAFGLFFFKVRDKPSRTIYYEELVYVVGSENECSLFFVEKETFIETRMNIFCKHLRARELNEDIVSYSIIRTKEKPRLLYGLAFLNEFKARFTGKSATIKIKKKNEKNEEEDEEEDEWNEEKKRTNEIENEILNNELLFLIEKCFVFHHECPFYFGSMSPEQKNPIPRSKKTMTTNFRFSEKGEVVEKKSSVDAIIDSLKKPKSLRDEEEEKKEIKGILKRPGEDSQIREKKKTIIKEDLDPPPKLNSSMSSNSSESKPNSIMKVSENPEKEKNQIKHPPNQSNPPGLSLAMAAKIKMKFKPPPPPPKKPPKEKPKVEEPEKVIDAKDLHSSDSEGDYSDELKMKPKLIDLKPMNASIKLALKLPPPPLKKAPIQETGNKANPPQEKIELQKAPTQKIDLTESKELYFSPKPLIITKEFPKPPPPPALEKKKTNEIIDNIPKPPPKPNLSKPPPLMTNMETSIKLDDKFDKKPQETNSKKEGGDSPSKKDFNFENNMAISKNLGLTKKDKTPKAQDLKNLDLKSLLKSTIKIKGDQSKKTSFSTEKDPSSAELKSNKNQSKPGSKPELPQGGTKSEINSEFKSDIKFDNKPETTQETLKKKSIEKKNPTNEKPNEIKEKNEDQQPQKKLNLSLANALKSFPLKAPIKTTKPLQSEEDKFFQLDEEDKIPIKKKEEMPPIKKFEDEVNQSNTTETKKPSLKNPIIEPTEVVMSNEKKQSISKRENIGEPKNISQESDNQMKDLSFAGIENKGLEESQSPKSKPVRKKTQKSTPSDTSSQERDKSLPEFIKKVDGGDESDDKKESSPLNKGPQSLSDKLKMRANKFKKR